MFTTSDSSQGRPYKLSQLKNALCDEIYNTFVRFNRLRMGSGNKEVKNPLTRFLDRMQIN